MIINIIDGSDSMRKNFNVGVVKFSDAFSAIYNGDGQFTIDADCVPFTTLPTSPPPFTTPEPTTPWPTTPPFTGPTSPPTTTISPDGWYCVGFYDDPVPQCVVGYDLETIDPGDYEILGGPYESASDCEGLCGAPPTTPPVFGCCGTGILNEGPFLTEEAAEEFAASHAEEIRGCQEMGGECPECAPDDFGCKFGFDDVYQSEDDNLWYVRYTLTEDNCVPCTTLTPTTLAPTTIPTTVPSTSFPGSTTTPTTVITTPEPTTPHTEITTAPTTEPTTEPTTVITPEIWFCYTWEEEPTEPPFTGTTIAPTTGPSTAPFTGTTLPPTTVATTTPPTPYCHCAPSAGVFWFESEAAAIAYRTANSTVWRTDGSLCNPNSCVGTCTYGNAQVMGGPDPWTWWLWYITIVDDTCNWPN